MRYMRASIHALQSPSSLSVLSWTRHLRVRQRQAGQVRNVRIVPDRGGQREQQLAWRKDSSQGWLCHGLHAGSSSRAPE